MNRIIPKISSGNFDLLLTESLCFNPLDGLKIHIPTSDDKTGRPGKDITFNFIFNYDQNPNNREIKTNLKDNKVDVIINNFGGSVIAGILKPLTFQFGNIPIKLYFTGLLLKENPENFTTIHFTVSIYQGRIK